MMPVRRRPSLRVRFARLAVAASCAMLSAVAVNAQVKASLPADVTPAWTKGIQAISPESYYNAIDCGKKGGQQSACVFWDTGLCKNDDFTLNWYTPYKQVAYEVWLAASKKQPIPQPSFPAAQRTRVTIGLAPVKGAKNVATTIQIKRGGQTIKPATQALEADGGGKFIFDYSPFAPTTDITLEFVGKARTITCTVDQATLALFR